jgi:prepilin-type N-terminal cleavage/methylation domain-containing protein
MRNARGFSLIELAIVIFIVSILLGAMLGGLNALTIGAREKATRTKQEAIKTALASFLVRNNRLPCPAIITTPTGAAGNGVEAATPGTCVGVISLGVAPNVVKTGAIPWVSLGLPEEATLDGYSNRFTYQVIANATNLTSATVSGMLGNISIHSAGFGIVPPGAGANQINNCTTGTYNPCAAVAVIVSHGSNGHGAYTGAGQQVPFPATVTGNDERENTNGDSQFVVKPYSDIEANPYDDIVLAMTASDFLTPLAATGSLKDAQTNLNATMTLLKGTVIAKAYASGAGGGGSPRSYTFPASLLAAGLTAAQTNDPWNTPVVYALSTPSVTCTTAPGTVFTLTSLGQDKVVNAALPSDDITVTVTVADVQALIALAGCNN